MFYIRYAFGFLLSDLLAKPEWHWHWSQGEVYTIIGNLSWFSFSYRHLTFYVDWIWVDKPAIKGLQLGPTKLELDKNDSSYFDKYLNEIIYYFEVSGTNLVIFEDLDRFDDPYIFDALHELNELINISLGQERFIRAKVFLLDSFTPQGKVYLNTKLKEASKMLPQGIPTNLRLKIGQSFLIP